MKSIPWKAGWIKMGSIVVFGLLFLGLGASGSSVVHAETPLNSSLLGGGSETHTLLENISGGIGTILTPGQVIFNIVSVILGFLGLIGVIMMMYGGFLWLTAGGEEEKAKQGSTLLFQAFIGSAIVLSAYMVTYFVLAQLTTAVTH